MKKNLQGLFCSFIFILLCFNLLSQKTERTQAQNKMILCKDGTIKTAKSYQLFFENQFLQDYELKGIMSEIRNHFEETCTNIQYLKNNNQFSLYFETGGEITKEQLNSWLNDFSKVTEIFIKEIEL